MPNKNQPFNERIKKNIAEEKFEAYVICDECREKSLTYCKHRNLELLRYGLNGKSSYLIKRFVRNTPDYIVLKNKKAYLVEVKGCEVMLGLKLKDFDQYIRWNSIMPLCYFIYSVIYKEHIVMEHKDLMRLTTTSEIKQYPDHNKFDEKLYYSIHFKTLLNL